MIAKIKIFGIFNLSKTTKNNTYTLEEDIYKAKDPVIALLVKLTDNSGQYYILKHDKLYNYCFQITVGYINKFICVSETATTEPKELVDEIINKTYENMNTKELEFDIEYGV